MDNSKIEYYVKNKFWNKDKLDIILKLKIISKREYNRLVKYIGEDK